MWIEERMDGWIDEQISNYMGASVGGGKKLKMVTRAI